MIALSQRRCDPYRHAVSRPAYSYARAGSLWVPENRVEFIGGGVGGSFAARGLMSGRGSPLTWPGNSSLEAWYHWAFDRQYNADLANDGTGTHPNIGWTGTVPIGLGLRVECNVTGGARGTATFRWSTDNGVTWVGGGSGTQYTTAATVNLGTIDSRATGVTLVFQSATYLTTNSWILTVGSFRDQTGNGHHLAIVGAFSECPHPLVTAYGTGIGCDGVDDLLQCADTLADTLVGGADNDFCAFIVARIENTSPSSGTGSLLFMGNSANNRSMHCYITSAPTYFMRKWDDVPAAVNVSGGTPNTSIHLHEFVQYGTTAEILIDGASVVEPDPQNLGTLTGLNNVTLGASFLSGARASFLAVTYFEIALYSSALDATTRADLRGRFRAPYGF